MTEPFIDLSLDIYHVAPTFAFDPKCAVIVHNTVDSIGNALFVNLSHKKPKEPITVDDFAHVADRIGEGTRLIYRTDWDAQFPQKHYFFDFPYMTIELAEWLAERKIDMIGMNVPTPNPTDFDPVHKILLGAEIVIVEGLANLLNLEQEEFFFIAAPLRIRGRNGSPVRALAMRQSPVSAGCYR